MPIQTNCAQAIRLFHVPLPGSAKDAKRLRRAFKEEKLRNGKIAVSSAKNPVVHGQVYRGMRIILQIARPFPVEALSERFWKEIGALVAKTKEPWWDFCELVTDWKPGRSHPEAHALSIWRVTNKGELKCLHYEDPDLYLPGEVEAKGFESKITVPVRDISKATIEKWIKNDEADAASVKMLKQRLPR